jgi:F-type H+-transporting ATPase subunit delta
MAELATVARPYAEAAFALARESSDPKASMPKWAEMLRALSGVAQDAQMQSAIDSPKLSSEQKTALFSGVCGDTLNDVGRKFVSTVVEAGRAKLLPQIYSQFETLKNEAENAAVAVIRTAMPLTEEQRASFSQSLQRKFGKTIQIKETVDESLIAGAIISVGDQVIDGSAKGRLAAMAVGVKV